MSAAPVLAGSPSTGAGGIILSAPPSPVPSPTPATKTASGSIRVGTDPNPSPAPSQTTTHAPVPAGSRAKTPARLPSTPPSRSRISAMLARAAKARGFGRSAQKKTAPTTKTSPAPPHTTKFSKDPSRILVEEVAIHISPPAADVASGSGSRGATFDEVVSRFVASCPGGDLTNMAKLPTDILVAKGASVLAEVKFFFLSYYSFFLLSSTNSLLFL